MNGSLPRTLVERATGSWVLRRRLPARFGRAPVYVSPGASLRYAFRPVEEVDPTLLSLATETVARGAVVWDVGANVGLFAVAAAHLAGEGGALLALEPDAWLVRLLRKTSGRQARTSAPITVVPAAAASAVSLRSFVIARRSRSASSLEGFGTTQTGGLREVQTVVAVSLDFLLGFFPPPSVLKIDVEGAEMEVLRGAVRLFEESRPVVICEVGTATAMEVTEYLQDLGYRLYDGASAERPRTEVALATWCTLALPGRREAVGRVGGG